MKQMRPTPSVSVPTKMGVSFKLQLVIRLWLTVLFCTFAEALAGVVTGRDGDART